MRRFEVLFEYSGCRIVLITELRLLVKSIQSELSKLGLEEWLACPAQLRQEKICCSRVVTESGKHS